MPTIEFDFHELPHAADTQAEGYYPIVVTQNKVDEQDLCEHAAKTTTLNPADMKAALSVIADFLADHLADGDRVELPGIGSFGLRISSDGPITYRDDKQISRNLKVRGISFTPKKELLYAISEDLHFRRVSSLHRTIPDLPDEEVATRLRALLASGREPLLTRADIQAATGYTESRALRELPGWVERGLLVKLGTPASPYYRLAPEYSGE